MFSLTQTTSVIAGPCSIESREQMEQVAKSLVRCHIPFIRGGAYKPRTSPYSFQGLGIEGLKILSEIGRQYGLLTVSEILDPRDVELGVKYLDLIQIGSRNMSNFSLLKEVGKTKKPVLLKRGYMSTVSEFLHAAEYIVSEGNTSLIMCERGIRSFENSTRNILDIAGIALIQKETSLPVVVDLSHSLGRKDILPPVAKAVLAMGIDGIMLEVHPQPEYALSDQQQQLNLDELDDFLQALY
jgi:3-deoxy-7-phosphoheptulonate synthase/chorismate mutase